MLQKLVKQAPPEDFYLLRLISEHPPRERKNSWQAAGASIWRDP
jgi:hypothetical protein